MTVNTSDRLERGIAGKGWGRAPPCAKLSRILTFTDMFQCEPMVS